MKSPKEFRKGVIKGVIKVDDMGGGNRFVLEARAYVHIRDANTCLSYQLYNKSIYIILNLLGLLLMDYENISG